MPAEEPPQEVSATEVDRRKRIREAAADAEAARLAGLAGEGDQSDKEDHRRPGARRPGWVTWLGVAAGLILVNRMCVAFQPSVSSNGAQEAAEIATREYEAHEREKTDAISILSTDSSSTEAKVDVCDTFSEHGAIPSAQLPACGAVYLTRGKALLGESKFDDAATLLQKAGKAGITQASLAPLLTEVEYGAEMSKAEEGVAMAESKLAGRDFIDAMHRAIDAQNEATRALAVKPSDPRARALIQRVGAILKKAKPAADAVLGKQQRAERLEAARQKKEQEKAVAAQREAEMYSTICGTSPLRSSWDGEVLAVKYYLKEAANDPDSIEVTDCTEPTLTRKSCWTTTCKVRGRNAFGGKILNTMRFSIGKGRDNIGQVLGSDTL